MSGIKQELDNEWQIKTTVGESEDTIYTVVDGKSKKIAEMVVTATESGFWFVATTAPSSRSPQVAQWINKAFMQASDEADRRNKSAKGNQ